MRSKGQPIRPQPPRPATVPSGPERWSADAGAGDVARLDIPPDAHRDRTFEIACSFVVAYRGDDVSAWHELRVLANGAQEWQRRVPTHPGGRDSLDMRFRRTVPLGEPLRLGAPRAVSFGPPGGPAGPGAGGEGFR